MVTALIIWLLKKYIINKKVYIHHRYIPRLFARKTIITLLTLIFLSPKLSAGQGISTYNILYKGNNIGKMYLTQVKNGDDMQVKIVSNVDMRIVMAIKVRLAEESFYRNEMLMYSNVYQEVNGKVKVNRQTKFIAPCYETISEGKRKILNKRVINYNVARLYNKEPVNISYVYSDSFQQYQELQAIGAHVYKLILPEGHYNIYHYENGTCSKVEVHSRLYTIEMQLDR
jgi:hypothetical protein